MNTKKFSRLTALAASLLLLTLNGSRAECFGQYPYQVCSRTYTDSSGNIRVESNDSMGNSYSLDTKRYTGPSGENVITSSDSMGNSYSLRTWSDTSGVHSVDSMGNRCTITRTGQVLGCK